MLLMIFNLERQRIYSINAIILDFNIIKNVDLITLLTKVDQKSVAIKLNSVNSGTTSIDTLSKCIVTRK